MILYITRKYPPSVGGMQQVNFELSTHLKDLTEVTLLAWGRSQKFLPLVLIYFFFKASLILFVKPKIKIVFLGDAMLAPLGLFLKAVFRKKTVVMAHGLDITFPPRIYQQTVIPCLTKLDKIICVSQQTKEQCLKRRVPEDKLAVIPNGIDTEKYNQGPKTGRASPNTPQYLRTALVGKKVILSVGRFVERKGFHHFIKNIFPGIIDENKDIIYILAGDGPYRPKIEKAIKETGFTDKIYLAGKVSDSGLQALYGIADIFVMPNIPVAGDMEGFGIVALEAGAAGVPVVASNIDGIKEAIKNGENGLLVDCNDPNKFAQTVLNLLKDNNQREGLIQKAKIFIRDNYSWKKIAKRYFVVISDLPAR